MENCARKTSWITTFEIIKKLCEGKRWTRRNKDWPGKKLTVQKIVWQIFSCHLKQVIKWQAANVHDSQEIYALSRQGKNADNSWEVN